mmetsp:Transcript_2393/g.5319  ORF Transcript_2393/g.5319 Transcript_2393/m.5319 type:complete len:393 (+) Transcript_2393:50-1228(+)|eukprot:CAMPEP_0204253994 /NCGR_PEP_ID=MMETSP0468-20130131/2273_1 /ASSEMBLY_ACC=CAM_ASM_000383 /TAXON_ID=2969 /ORGANISM="Oxyrrhis marina" /LENGTH=392 /DNA_ID=CAMNT_0051227677 /DNA_START=26 /DNA_END=1204 /DNA_ORIENTATION=-
MGKSVLWIAICLRIHAVDFFSGFSEGLHATLSCSADADCLERGFDAICEAGACGLIRSCTSHACSSGLEAKAAEPKSIWCPSVCSDELCCDAPTTTTTTTRAPDTTSASIVVEISTTTPAVEYSRPEFEVHLDIMVHLAVPNAIASEFLNSARVELESALAAVCGMHLGNVACGTVTSLSEQSASIGCVLTAETAGNLTRASAAATSATGGDELGDLLLQELAAAGNITLPGFVINVTAGLVSAVDLDEAVDPDADEVPSDDQSTISVGAIAGIMVGVGAILATGALVRYRSKQRYRVFTEVEHDVVHVFEENRRGGDPDVVVEVQAGGSDNCGLQQCLEIFEQPPAPTAAGGEMLSSSRLSASGGTVVRAPTKGERREQDSDSVKTGSHVG